MKKILLLAALLQLSGCVLFDAYFAAKYDNNEYGLVTKIKTIAETTECGNVDVADNAKAMWIYSVELKNFTQHLPRNEKSHEMTSKLSEITMGLHNKHGQMSKVYCEEKLKIIIKTTDDIQKALGSKPR